MPAEIITLLSCFASAFTTPSWNHFVLLFEGAVLCRGPRRITTLLRVLGLEADQTFGKYHRFLSRSIWSGLLLAQRLLGLLIACLPKDWPIVITVDDTLERRWGKKIRAKGVYRDAVRSSKHKTIHSSGLKWSSMMLLLPVPWSTRVWALPFLTVLMPSQQANKQVGKRHKTNIDWTGQMVSWVSRFLKRRWVLVGDGAYAAMALVHRCIRCGVTLVSRFRLDVALYEPAPEPTPGKRGRKRVKGERIRLKALIEDPTTD